MVFHVFEATVPPPPRPDNKARRGYYTRTVLCEAVKQAMLGTMTVTEAARFYKIPRTTIQKHVSKAREQHNLKEHYIRRMEAVRRGLEGRMPERDVQRRLSEQRVEYLMSCGLEAWPNVSNDDSAPTHWRQQPVRIDSDSPKYLCKTECSFENDMIVAEQCEVHSEETSSARPRLLDLEQDSERTKESTTDCVSDRHAAKISVKPITRVVLKREGKDDIVKEVLMPKPCMASQRGVFLKDSSSSSSLA
ncbi:hypothetical protein RB195_016216 [Necator americanus]|uniref:HTH psq-type domain-containing protein n=1 Tax=Necator americanus TaxID=51031 RepID=A0ABR1E835_NECAM